MQFHSGEAGCRALAAAKGLNIYMPNILLHKYAKASNSGRYPYCVAQVTEQVSRFRDYVSV
jgi:hypothetical protein